MKSKISTLLLPLILLSGLALGITSFLVYQGVFKSLERESMNYDLLMAGGVSGSVFRDYNGDGIKQPNEPLVGGVAVTAYNSLGVACGTTTTSSTASPNYTIMTCAGQVRVEFTIDATTSCVDSTIDFSSTSGGNYGSSVQFADASAMPTVNFALNNPAEYNKGAGNTSVFVPCYTNGNPTGAGTAQAGSWFVGFPYNNSGVGTPPSLIKNGTVIGATWGVAYSRQAKKIFTSAFIKRHVGLGSLGSGGIYTLTPSGGTFTAGTFYDMDANGHRTRAAASAPAYGVGSSFNLFGAPSTKVTYLGAIDPLTGKPSGFGVVGTNLERGLPANKALPSFDPAAFAQVGKVGLGDLDISDDGKYLFVTNLYNRYLFRLTLDNPVNPTSVTAVDSFQLPPTACTSGELRPFGLKYYRNKVYIGAVCTGENNGINVINGASDLFAHVYVLSDPTGAGTIAGTPVFSAPLNYKKGPSMNWTGPHGGQWNPWRDSTISFGNSATSKDRTYPTPQLSDIEFSDRGDLIMSFTDRAGHQYGWGNYRWLNGNPSELILPVSGGDLLVAGLDCGSNSFVLESNGSYDSDGIIRTSTSAATMQGPGGDEFFDFENIACCHQETHGGSVAVLRGDNKIITTTMDPTTIREGGTVKFSFTNGTKSHGYQLFVDNTNSLASGNFGKAAGLGDMEVSGFEAPLEIGNRVWVDANMNGVQDAGEAAFPNITVQLVDSITGAIVGTDITDANGNYYFDTTNVLQSSIKGPQANRTYYLRIGPADWVSGGAGTADLLNYTLTGTDQNPMSLSNADLRDNDGSLFPVTFVPTIKYRTGNLGENNHTLDFGFFLNPPVPPVVDLALTKTVDTIINNNINTNLTNGDTVKFKIQLTNQGVVSMDSLNVTDYLPSGFKFINATGTGQLNEGWDGTDPNNPVYIWRSNTGIGGGAGIQPVQSLPLTVQSGDGVTSLSFMHNPGTGSNRLLLLGIAVGNNGGTGEPPTVTSAQFQSVNLDLVGTLQSPGAAGSNENDSRIYIYKFNNPTGTGSIDITLSGTGDIVVEAVTFTGVDLSNPLGTFQSTNGLTSPVSQAFTAASGEVLYSMLAVDGGTTATGSGGQIGIFNGSTDEITGAAVYEAGPNPTTSFSLGANQDWALGAVAIKPFIQSPFGPSDTLELCIYTTLQHVPGTPTPADFTNYSEISFARDTNGVNQSVNDIDSPLNNDPNDNAGGQPNSPADDYVNGNGSGTPGDGIAATDQDNHDPAFLSIFDLALKKTIDTGSISNVYSTGDTIQFNITVTNQGTDTAQDIQITDTIPCGLTFSALQPVSWSLSGQLATYTITGLLLPGQSVIVSINLIINSSCSPLYTVNYAQISGAKDVDGNPVTGDVDGPYDQNFQNDAGGEVNSNSDDVTSGDGTGVPFDEVALTDEDDQDPAELLVFDLALRKVVSPLTTGYPGPYNVGDLIRFDITIFNQGNLPAVEVNIVDTIPAGLTFMAGNNPSNWVAGPESNEFLWNLDLSTDTLNGGEDTTISIFLNVVHTSGGIPAYTNIAEISSAVTIVNATRDTFAQDADSPYDSNFTNDAGGQVNSPADNEILGNGSGVAGDGIAETDEDAHDPALVPIVDVALRKVISDTLHDATNFNILDYGDTIKFDITVINQGTVSLDSIEVTDYIPSGFAFGSNPDWTFIGPDTATVIRTRLDPGEDTVICIYLILVSEPNQSALTAAWINYAEISQAWDTLGFDVSTIDFDSQLDDVAGNNGGGQPGSAADNYVDGNGASAPNPDGVAATDQDNHDPAFVEVFDVALRKVIGDTLGDAMLGYGDTIRFDIHLFNQANTIVDSLVITDYMPAGFVFIPGLNPDWSGTPPNPIYEWGASDDLLPGESDTISIYLQLIAVGEPSLADYTNYAEISFASDTTGVDRSSQDADSPLNALDFDNPGGQPLSPADDFIDGDGTGVIGDGVDSTDQDNHDPAGLFPRIVDLALKKQNQSSGPFSYGDTVALLISVINQGTITIDSIEVTDYLPVGFSFPAATNPDWTVSGSNLVTVYRTPLAGGGSAFIPLYLVIQPIVDLTKVDSAWINFAEISRGWEGAADVSGEDLDGPWDDNPDNNPGGKPNSPADDYIDGDGSGNFGDGVDTTDLDSHDPLLVPIADLALRKVKQDTLGDAILNYGDTIKFGIQLFNQGNVLVDSIVVSDSIPAGYSFVPGSLNTGWVLSGNDANYFWGIGDTLFPGESDTICIYLTLNMVTPSASAHWINRAEITFFSDTLGVPLVDADSDPDDSQSNDPGGNPNTPSDDPIDGDGAGMPGDTSSMTDEDDEDPDGINFFDLALVKTVAPGSVVTAYNDSVKFLITVINQGTEPVDSVTIIDSLPAGLQFDNALPVNDIWTQNVNELITTIVGRLNPGEDTTICLALRILKNYDLSQAATTWVNLAEISAGYDTTGVPIVDIDSPLNDNYGDNAGGQPESPADDEEAGDGTGPVGSPVDSTDQDNADPALVQVADLALRKVPSDTLGDNILIFGDTVKIAIQVFNQGSVPVDSFIVNDSLPAGLGFVTGPLNAGWNLVSGSEYAYNWGAGDTLFPGESDTLCIYVIFQLGFPGTPETYTNRAEISAFFDTDGNPLDDVDSSPDDNQTNDPGGEPKTGSDDPIDGDGTGMPGDTSSVTDEDDQDPLELGFFDLALRKVISPGSAATAYGDTVKFDITIFNQGSIPSDSIIITDSLPAGFSFNASIPGNAGWVQSGNKLTKAVSGQLLTGLEDTTVCLWLTVEQVLNPAERATAWINYAEISEAWLAGNDISILDIDSELNPTYGDNAGGQPESPADDEVEGDGTGAIGDGVDTTDQDNADPALVEIVDLALRKIIMDTLGDATLEYGDTVKFAIHLFNQGNVPVDSLVVNDTLPNGFSFVNDPGLNAGWVLAGNEANYGWGSGDTLFPGESDTICIYLRLDMVVSGIPDFTNRAEISYAEDTTGADRSSDDIDSPLNDNYGDNAGGQPESPADDEVEGDGTGMIGDGVDTTDQDNADPARVEVMDLALRKLLVAGPRMTAVYGDTAEFIIEVINQGNVPATQIKITDSLPDGFATDAGVNPDWTIANSGSTFTIMCHTITDTLYPGDTVRLPFNGIVESSILLGAWINYAEITSMKDTTNADRSGDDIDSSPDANVGGNDSGGQPETEADDETNGDGTGVVGDGVASTDEDDEDPAALMLFNLALRKVIDPANPGPYKYGDTVNFIITVFNQANIPATNIVVSDSIPAGFIFDATLNPTWSNTAPIVRHTLTDTINFGDSVLTSLSLIIQPVADPAKKKNAWTNLAEISYAEDTSGNNTNGNLFDHDSRPDENFSNDAGGRPESPADNFVFGNGQGIPGDGVAETDEDDADPALVEVFDLALVKQIDSAITGTPMPYTYGDLIKYKLRIINQGNEPAVDIEVTDYIPEGLVFDGPANPDWALVDDSTATTMIADTLFADEDTTICIYLRLQMAADRNAWINVSEISNAKDTTDRDMRQLDADHVLDGDRTNNAGSQVNSPADDFEDGDGTGVPGDGVASTDGDNIDPAWLDVFDLALIKTTPHLVVQEGEVVDFYVTIYNQGNIDATNIKVTDYIPQDMSLAPSPGWTTLPPDSACYTYPGPLMVGDSFTIQINLQVDDPAIHLPEGLYNYAEISSAMDIEGTDYPDVDGDFDTDPNNDPGGDLFNDDDNNISGNGKLGEDEDNHDGAYVIVCKGYVCNNQVNVSFGDQCEIVITGDDVLENPSLPAIQYRVTLWDASGREVPNATLTRAHLGYCFTYSVDAPACPANSCWGTICVEDKAPPFIDCSPDTVLCFELSNLPSEGTVIDNCSGPVTVSVVSEQYIDFGCDSAFIQGVVKRRLIATDTWKNTMDCEKIYYVRRLNIEDLVCPRDTVIDCSLEIVNKIPFSDPRRSGAPTIEGIALWPNNVSCKVLTDYKDEISEVCGDGYKIYRTWTIVDWCGRRDTMCTQTIKVIDQTPPLAYDRTLPTRKADPHDCRALIQLDTLAVSDCSKVIQTYSYPYLDEATGVIKIASGTLPARVWVTSGVTVIDVTLTDGCFNRSQNTITVKVVDETPPTPVCKEYTQVTVDPVSCWTVVKAKDLDNGSHDNCIGPLHFAVARMVDIEKARADYLMKIEVECGRKEYLDHKAWYDQNIEDWINMYVFDDELHMDDCGENQVVLRVYEADSMPRMDSHIWPCGEHEWFCYNTYPSYRLVHNYHFFSTNPPATKDCDAGAPWLCKKASEKWFADGKTQFEFSRYYGANEGANFPQTRLYNDCMVKVIVDDKQPPLVDHLEDITVYCDNAPAGKAYARQLCKQGEEFQSWPGPLSYQGVTYGYYGGSNHIQRGHTDHQDPVYGCDHEDQWAPIYCRDWLYLDRFDQTGPVDPAQYFSTLVKFDKDRPARALGAKEFSITDNCRLDDTTMHFTDIGSVNGCGEGWYQRTWTIKDKCGNVAKAVQKVIVKHRSDYEVVFPPDLEVTCDTENATDSSQTGKPIITDDECEIIGVRYVDEISTVDDEVGDGGQGPASCYKIIRTWTLIDWCIYDPNAHTIHPDVIVDDRLRANETDRVCVFRNLKDNGDGFMRYVQIIKVFDHEAPVLNCRDTTICLTEGCQKAVNIPLEGLDNCAEEILYRLDITRPDGSIETRVNVNSITGNFTVGVYTIRIIGKDKCDNADTCTMRLTMRDCKEPTPYCLNGVATVVMPLTGAIEIWAKDLDRGSSDNCTLNSSLKFSFSSNVSEASRVFRCSDILDGKQQAIFVDIWVTDQAGNQNYCRTYILLQDNGGQPGGVCRDTTLTTANINGKLYTEDKEGVEFATVEVKGVGQAAIPSFKTGSDGNYAFSNIQLTGTVSIKALRDDNPMNGLSTLDLVLLQKHLLGTEKLKSPYKVIAADIDNSQDISVVDLIELRKLILGIYDNIPGNTSWKFIPKSHSFADVQNPWGYPTEEQMDKMNEQEVRDFVGVKIGDLNSSAVPHSLIGTEVRGNEIGLTLETEDRLVKKGEEVSVTFRSPNFRGISGWQGTLHTGSLQFTGVRKVGKLNLTDDHIGRRWAKEGMLTMSWNHHTGIDLDEEAPLFTLVFKAGEEGRLSEMLRFGSQHTLAESYEGKGELGGLSLRFVTADGNTVDSRSELYQNYPNPFDQRTVIGINLAREGKGVLRILDITGRTIKSIERDWTKGYQEVWLDRREIGATGVLYYRFESEFFTASRKMLIME